MRLRYRARTEWNGIELFDRDTGRVHRFGEQASGLLSELLSDHRRFADPLPDELAGIELYRQHQLNVEPLITTPYPKSDTYASAPRRVYWEFTRRCNLACGGCYNRTATDEELSLPSLLRIARQMYDAGVYEIRCTGGEFTCRSDWLQLVHALSDMGFYLSMGTNAVYTPHTLKQVMAAPLQWIIISLDGGDDAAHAQIRGAGAFQAAVTTLERLSEKGCRIRINTLIRRGHYRYEHLQPLVSLCERFGIESLNCIPLRPVTYDPDVVKLQLTPDEFRVFIADLNRLRQESTVDFVTTLDLRHTALHDRVFAKDRSCAAGREGAVISPNGEIYGCSYSPASNPRLPLADRQLYVAGDLRSDDFLSIWNDSSHWEIYRNLGRYKHAKCQACTYYHERRCIGNCPIMVEGDPGAFDPYCYLNL